MAQDSTVSYPAVRDLLARVSNRTPMTNARLAASIGKSATLISNFRSGVRAPSTADIDRIARAFFPVPDRKKDPNALDLLASERDSFREQLKSAAREKVEVPRGDTLQALVEHASHVILSSADCKPISGNLDCAFESLFMRFVDLCGLTYNPPSNRLYFDADGITPTTMLLSVFDTVERMLQLQFFRVPVHMGLNGIMEKRFAGRVEDVAKALSMPRAADDPVIRPVVLPNSVGWTHCSRRLKYKPSELVLVPLRPGVTVAEQMARQLAEEVRSLKPGIPVVCADELLSLKVLHFLPKLKVEGLPVFALNSRTTPGGQTPWPDRPLSYISLAIRRGNSGFRDFLRDALIQFLDREANTAAQIWFRLAKEMLSDMFAYTTPDRVVSKEDRPVDFAPDPEKEFESARIWRMAWEWLRVTLTLDRESIESYADPEGLPWKPILLRARAMMQQHLASDECMRILEGQVALARAEGSGIEELCDLFDVSGSDTVADSFGASQLRHAIQIQLASDRQ